MSNKNQKYKQILCLNVGMDLAFSARGKLSSLFGAVASFVLASVSAIKGKSTAASPFFSFFEKCLGRAFLLFVPKTRSLL